MYLAAFQLDIGESVFDACGRRLLEWWNVDGDTLTPCRPPEIFYGDVPPQDCDRAIAKLKPWSMAALTETLTAAAWKTTPSPHVLCEQDRAIPLAAQEQMSVRATSTHRLPTSHSPFLSKPGDVTRLITDMAAEAA